MAKAKVSSCKVARLQEEYSKKYVELKNSTQKGKGEWANNIAHSVQMKGVYEATRRLCSEPPKRIDMVRNKAGKL